MGGVAEDGVPVCCVGSARPSVLGPTGEQRAPGTMRSEAVRALDSELDTPLSAHFYGEARILFRKHGSSPKQMLYI